MERPKRAASPAAPIHSGADFASRTQSLRTLRRCLQPFLHSPVAQSDKAVAVLFEYLLSSLSSLTTPLLIDVLAPGFNTVSVRGLGAVSPA